MKGIPTELIYLLIIGAFLLFNYLTEQAARRKQAELAQEERPGEEASGEEPLPELWGRLPQRPAALSVPVAPVESAPRIAPPVRRTGRFSKRSLMGTKREVQNAVVIATILGPCRALEPPDSSPASAAFATSAGQGAQPRNRIRVR